MIELDKREKIMVLRDVIDSIEMFVMHSIFSCNALYLAATRVKSIRIDYGRFALDRNEMLKHNFPTWYAEVNEKLNRYSTLDSAYKDLSPEDVNWLRIELLQKELKLIENGND